MDRSAGAVSATPRDDLGAGFWPVWWLALAIFAAGGVLAADSGRFGEVPEIWLLSTTAFSWLTLSWRGVTPRPTRPLILTAVAVLVLSTATGLALEATVPQALRAAVGTLLQAALMCVAYRWARDRIGSPPRQPVPGAAPWRQGLAVEWAPTGARDLVALVVCAAVSALAVVPVGAVPGVWLEATSGEEVAEWLVRVCVTTFVGAASTILVFATWSPGEITRRTALLPVLGAISIMGMVGIFEAGALALNWLILLPSLYVASTYSIWSTSAYSLTIGVAALGITPTAQLQAAYDEVLPLTSAFDLLISVCVFVALTIGLLNEARDRLVAAVGEQQRRAHRQAQVLNAVFDSMEDGLVVLGSDLTIRMYNPAAVRLLGRPIPASPPENWADYFGITRVDGTPAQDEDLIGTEYLAVRREAGPPRVIRQRRFPITGGREGGMVVTFMDVTEQHQRLEELSGFASVVAHDLRAPLTSVEGWLELVTDALEHGRHDEAGALLLRAHAGHARMREIIEDWLRHAVEQEGQLHRTEFPVADPANLVVAQHAGSGPHVFEVDAPHLVCADMAMVRQVLDNVVGNASKYTPPGQVPHVRITSEPDGSPDWVRVEVADRGIGLPAGEEVHIFEDYHRVDKHAGHYEGSGLGLALCRRIVERHGGTISARNNEHGGVTIAFTLPAAPSARERQQAPASASGEDAAGRQEAGRQAGA